MKKEVTVLMSEYNTKPLELKEAIESILNQTYTNFEFFIVDDGTNKENKNILSNYSKKDNRIKIITNKENIGLVKSINKAITEVKTKYIARMDSDDIADRNRLEKQVKFMEENFQYALCGTRANYFNEGGRYLTSNIYGKINLDILIRFCVFFHSSIIIRTDILKQVGMYDEYKRNEDYALYLKMYYKGYKGYILEDVLINYRQDEKSFKRKVYKDRIIEYKIRRKYFKLLHIKGIKKYIYTVKPLIVGLIPKRIMYCYKKIRNIR